MKLEEFERHGRAFLLGMGEVIEAIKFAEEVTKNKVAMQKSYDDLSADLKGKEKELRTVVDQLEERSRELKNDLTKLQENINAAVQERQGIEAGITQRKKEIDAEMSGYRRQLDAALSDYKKEVDAKKANLQTAVDELQLQFNALKKKLEG